MEQLGGIAELGPVVSTVDNRLTDLKQIARETLNVSMRLSPSSSEEEELYDRLVTELTLLDEDALRAKENRLEQECSAELARKQQIATFQDLESLLILLSSKKQQQQ